MTDSSDAKITVQCDNCPKIQSNIRWKDYKKCIHEDGKYYCRKCASKLYGKEKELKTKLDKSKTFYDWCYDNLSKEEADIIMLRWDYDKNIDRKGNKLSPRDVSYGSSNEKYYFKCLDNFEHVSEWKNINSFTRGEGNIQCNQCSSISVTHPHLVKYLVNKEDALKYSFGSGKNILMKCPDCGYERELKIPVLIRQGFSCSKCSDGVPYPEKFMFNILEQILNKDFITQLSRTTFEWCMNYKYDNYINKISCIIETHGLQHYEGFNTKAWNSLDSIQDNDKLKKELAKENGIDNYIVIDCRKSELEWIKNSIMNSELPNLLNFNEEDIDWFRCHEYGCSNMVKEACGLWSSGNNAREIASILKIWKQTVVTYLKQGATLGWCDYNPIKEKNKSIKLRADINSKQVICLTTNEIFNSQAEAGKKYSVFSTCICACCRYRLQSAGKHPETGEKLKWMYYDEYLESQKLLFAK